MRHCGLLSEQASLLEQLSMLESDVYHKIPEKKCKFTISSI